MREEQTREVRRRRSRREVASLVAEYETSGLRRQEFCRKHGLSLGTLNRYRKRLHAQEQTTGGSRLVAVEVAATPQLDCEASSALTVLLAGGRRVEVRRGFDTSTLQQLVRVLERI
jgi:transposase-like protein